MVIVKYFALGKSEKAWFPRKNIEKGSQIYRLIINYSFHFYSIVKQYNSVFILFPFLK